MIEETFICDGCGKARELYDKHLAKDKAICGKCAMNNYKKCHNHICDVCNNHSQDKDGKDIILISSKYICEKCQLRGHKKAENKSNYYPVWMTHPKCPKCDTLTRPVNSFHKQTPVNPANMSYVFIQQEDRPLGYEDVSEVIRIICSGCRYTWEELPADAQGIAVDDETV